VELKEFVRDVLVQIAEGVREADAGVSAAGGVASPATHFGPVANAREIHFATMDTGAPVFLVDFDVAITVAEGSSVGGDARLRIATIFSAGIGAKGGESTASVSRVRFKVPVALPVNADSAVKVQAARTKAQRPLPSSSKGNFAKNW
jgi:hypothetical protein